MRRPYERNNTYSGHTQDIERLIDTADELGATSISIDHADGTHVTVIWDRSEVTP